MRLLIFFVFFVRCLVTAQNYCVPKGYVDNSRSAYYFGYNAQTKICNWIGYTVSADDVNGTAIQLRSFHKDSASLNSADPKDYKNYSYSMGRLMPRSAARGSKKAMYSVHNMLNIAPMDVAFERGAWRILDNMIAGWAVIFDSVHVVTGPVFYEKKHEQIGDGKVWVPDAFYKVVLVRNGLDVSAIGFIIPNDKKANVLAQYSMSVDSVEKVVGLNFFTDLPEYLEAFAEETINAELWKTASVSYKLKSAYLKEKQCVAAEMSDERCQVLTNCVSQNCWKHGCDINKNEK